MLSSILRQARLLITTITTILKKIKMARISTYPNDTNVTDGDKLIGTDVDNSDATKNFTIGDIVSHLASNHFVPYTGATQDVNIGTNDFQAENLQVTNAFIGNNCVGVDATFSNILTSGFLNSYFGINVGNGPLGVGALSNVGLSGQMLLSQGAGLPPQWSNTIPTLTVTGLSTFQNTVNAQQINASFLSSSLGVNIGNGSLGVGLLNDAGNTGDVLISQGPGAAPDWAPATAFLIPAAAAYHSEVNQSYDAINQIPSLMEFEVVDIFNSDIQVLANALGKFTKITFFNQGQYNIQFSAQLFKNPGGAPQKASIWFRKNGIDIPNTNRHTIPLNSNQYNLASWNLILDLLANDYIEILWAGIDIILQYEPINALPPAHPATPSTILTVNKVLST